MVLLLDLVDILYFGVFLLVFFFLLFHKFLGTRNSGPETFFVCVDRLVHKVCGMFSIIIKKKKLKNISFYTLFLCNDNKHNSMSCISAKQ